MQVYTLQLRSFRLPANVTAAVTLRFHQLKALSSLAPFQVENSLALHTFRNLSTLHHCLSKLPDVMKVDSRRLGTSTSTSPFRFWTFASQA